MVVGLTAISSPPDTGRRKGCGLCPHPVGVRLSSS
ncbi:hypothetical protein RHECNPAF_4460021 [Rhizobium etli CNPAF512]|nr:hypothetical protein RHECNPAF_4460021 [Rhizobium etli CNPAF512]